MKKQELLKIFKLNDEGNYESKTHIIYKNGSVFSKYLNGFLSSKSGSGYSYIHIARGNYRTHRIVYTLYKEDIPEELQIDHINNIKTDNRIENLRVLNRRDNCSRIQIKNNNTSGYIGVSFNKNFKKYNAQIQINNRLKFLASFLTPEEAAIARDNYILNNNLQHYTLNFPACFNNPEIKLDAEIRGRKIKLGFYGVSFDKSRNKYMAYARINSKKQHLGCFLTPEEAALTRDNYVLENNLFNLTLNFPGCFNNPDFV